MAPLLLNFKDDKKYKGLTTVWLLSTLGNSIVKENNSSYSSKSNSTGNISASTVKKKDIVNISIPKTCDEIQNFESDLSLRYISNLLYGVTICYNKKTEYVLNDLNHLLVQLQKNNAYAFKAKNKSTRINGLNNHNSIIGSRNNNYAWEECVFFDDDPLYDITKVPALDFLNNTLQDDISFIEEAKSIRRQDYINELSNSNRFELHSDRTNPDAQSKLGPNVRNSFSLDEIPIDVDFNLDLDDIVSHQGTPLGSHSSSQKDNNDLKFNYDGNELILNFENDDDNNGSKSEETPLENEESAANLKDYELGLEEQESEEENDGGQRKVGVKMQRGNRADVAGLLSKVQFDTKISYPNEVLKFNHGNYSNLMEKSRKKKISGQNAFNSSINSLVRSCGEAEFISTNWLSIFNDFSDLKTGELDLTSQDFGTIERGRKRAHSLVSTQSSNSIRSNEYGRKSFRNNKNDNYSSDMENDNLLLNLEQINEDLEEGHYIEENSQGNILDFNLNLPPSSFGRSHTRNSTRSSGFNEDIVGALRRRIGPSEQNFVEEGDSSNDYFSDSTQQNLPEETNFHDVILDYQTKKFYDYIKERSVAIGRTTRSNPPFKRKVLLVDIIPSRMGEAQIESNLDISEKGVSRQIAAGAFLSLLNLATKGMIKLNEYPAMDADNKDLRIRKEDEIIIYA
ncbi:hypothetical protein SMKI_16G1740 [Saccharomyces mikatae IFO 1815]|uniref:Rad21/Rec8-like protein N-terminal domain-containing protein n=1 Tax=Saccharomyces mikatae IFO 1815 TaxID=226126 RepID=A0AA35IWR6_SACMI|nr:uncharacterized protein SMKI_16G1740 [Saccharomyces mikatae IFO 1815]CAI4036877.1 hypothetical protein SMKI_16G1740 [Saccharomyces mikatae IFO 1815]